MPGPIYHTAGEEPIYHELCRSWGERLRASTRRPVSPTEDPDTAEQFDPERTKQLWEVADHMWGPWAKHKDYLDELERQGAVAARTSCWGNDVAVDNAIHTDR